MTQKTANGRAATKVFDSGEGDHVTLDRLGAVGLVKFSRPPGNYFSTSLLTAIADALEAADEDPDVRATTLASEGRNFCAGADLVNRSEDPPTLYAQALRLFGVRKPIVAAVQGAAIGGGLGLALVADFRVVTPSTRMAANFVTLGMHPGFGVTYVLPRIVGEQKAAEILLTGRRYTGLEARDIGLADRLVPEENLVRTALDLAGELAANAPLAVEATRSTLRADLVERIRQQTERETAQQLRLRDTADFAEGVRAVSERRQGRWIRR
uniref:Enoyl-CoA hydratase/isomerase n=1 Tax=Caulobacter sp. (strain K31) TaxID=366602 RepID=B0T3R1_CAUSK